MNPSAGSGVGGPPISPSAFRVGRSEDGDGSSELREAALAADGAIHRSNEVSNLSIATGETDRSALESKDRQQLATIARALGGKPTARTRKDELVEMILELADEGAGAPERDGDTMSDQTTEDAPATTDTNGSRDAGDASVDTGRDDARAEKADRDDDAPRRSRWPVPVRQGRRPR